MICRFWEEDEEFYRSFDGAIRNPFQMIDGMMEECGSADKAYDQQVLVLVVVQKHALIVCLSILLRVCFSGPL